MSECYDELDRHLPHADDIGQASMPMGMLLAWCARHHLLSDTTSRDHEGLLLRLRMEEARGSELLTACGGDLRRDMFNPAGQAFLDRYYEHYAEDLAECFDGNPYSVEDNWGSYGEIARYISRAYHSKTQAEPVVARLKRGWRRLTHREGEGS